MIELYDPFYDPSDMVSLLALSLSLVVASGSDIEFAVKLFYTCN
jgi:hypothetical protein